MSDVQIHQAVRQAGMLDVYGHFSAQVSRTPQAAAIREGEVLQSYADLDRRVRALAAALAGMGIGKGDRIAILSENRREYVELVLAAAWLGAIVACQNWRLAIPELRHCIGLVAPRLAVASRRFLDNLRNAAADVPAVVIEDDWERLIAETPPTLSRPAVDEGDGLLILYTSGTTGLPKGALISHRAEIARMTIANIDLSMQGRGFVAWAPMFHMASTDQMLGVLMSGGTVHVCDGFDPEAIMRIVETEELGWLFLVPGSIEPLLELLEQGRSVRGVRVVGAMADLVPRSIIARMSDLCGAPFLNSFGSTETGLAPLSGGLVQGDSVSKGLSKRQSSLCAFRLVDAEGSDVAPGEIGEGAIKGPSVFSGYWAAEEINARDFAGGWFRMGDLFRQNPDGGYDFVDRAKYMIKSGGENIYPAEIERVLLSDPRIEDAIVVRKADARWGEVPVALIARRDESLGDGEVEAMCREQLAGYKRPREVHFISASEFRRSTTGKILRSEMEAWLRDHGNRDPS